LSISCAVHSTYETSILGRKRRADVKLADQFAQLRAKVNNYPFLGSKVGVENLDALIQTLVTEKKKKPLAFPMLYLLPRKVSRVSLTTLSLKLLTKSASLKFFRMIGYLK
jgi:hypothetical protein